MTFSNKRKRGGRWNSASGDGDKPKLTDHGLGSVVIHPGEKTGFTIEGELAPKP